MADALTFDPELAYPGYDKPFLKSWNGRFEAVFVALHPFFRMPGVDPINDGYIATPYASSAAGKTAFEAAERERSPAATEFLKRGTGGSRLLASIGYPEDGWDAAQRVTWAEVADQSGLGSREEVGTALLALIGALREPYSEEVARLVRYCEQTRTFPPREGRFEDLHLGLFLDLFRRVGSQAVQLQEEFDDQPVVNMTFEEAAVLPWRGSLYSPDKSVLIVVDWDSYFTLVAGDRELLEPWIRDHAVDGFFADEATTHNWWARPIQPN